MNGLSFYEGYLEGKRRQDEIVRKCAAEARTAVPLRGHPYHKKTDAELHYIARDAHAAAQAMKGHSPDAENKYWDQVNDASTVLGYRRRGGKYRGEAYKGRSLRGIEKDIHAAKARGDKEAEEKFRRELQAWHRYPL
jgi:hypothetical protein